MASYNPLDYRNLGINVANALLEQEAVPLNSLRTFNGAGIYALYYTGDFSLYEVIVDMNSHGRLEMPIYIGKASSPGARRGGWISGAQGTSLHSRLREHLESVDAAGNLNADDFHCRYLVVDDVWIGLGEAMLIDRFAPVWNKTIAGFGIHDPGKGRASQRRSEWDTLHPGRSFAENRPPNQTSRKELSQRVREYLDGRAAAFLSEAEQDAEARSDEVS